MIKNDKASLKVFYEITHFKCFYKNVKKNIFGNSNLFPFQLLKEFENVQQRS